MKKIFSALALLSLLAVMVAPVVVLAQETPPSEIEKCTMRHDFTTNPGWATKGFKCASLGSECKFDEPTQTCGACCVLDTIYTVTDWIFIIAVAVAAIMVFVGAFSIITAGGAAEKVTTGRTYIMMAIVGLIIALLAKAIPQIAKSILGM